MAECRLFPKAQLFGNAPVALNVIVDQIIQQPAPLAYQLQEAPPGGMVLPMGLQMSCQVLDPVGENGNLYFRGACVIGILAKFLDVGLRLLLSNHSIAVIRA